MARRSEAELLAFHEEQAKKIRERLEHRTKKANSKTYARCARLLRDLNWLVQQQGESDGARSAMDTRDLVNDMMREDK